MFSGLNKLEHIKLSYYLYIFLYNLIILNGRYRKPLYPLNGRRWNTDLNEI